MPCIAYVFCLVLIQKLLDQNAGFILCPLLNKIPEALKSDFMSLYDAIEQQGIEKGIHQGMEKGIELSITNGYQIGLTIDQLAKQSGWDKEDVVKLLKSKGLLK